MKKEIRKHIRSLKASYSPEELKGMSTLIIDILCSHPLYKDAKCILMYYSLDDEVCTHELINEACKDKMVLLPTVVGETLELHTFDSTSDTHEGAFNIIESEGLLFTAFEEIDLAIIPGMAFDEAGNRLGRGKGYYDRLLPKLKCPIIGLCFPFQKLNHIPTESYDIPVNQVIC